jgi:hypothetical protein
MSQAGCEGLIERLLSLLDCVPRIVVFSTGNVKLIAVLNLLLWPL